jgi:chemotaxis protein methyltransferase CheR
MTPRGTISREEYQAFQVFLERATGIVLGDNKEYLVASRLGSLLRQRGLPSLGALLELLRRDADRGLRTAVIDAMTTNETFWFRDLSHFRLLTEQVLPELAVRPRPLRIWSAACSTGQEPYSIAMAVQDFQRRSPGRLSGGLEVVATDISTKVLAEARSGRYCGMAVSRGLEPEQRRLYFQPHGDCLDVRPELRRGISFRELNLAGSYGLLGRFDIIFCRNVLIYFSSELKADILHRMAQVLHPGSYLFLGSTESLSGHNARFDMVTGFGGIVYRLRQR